MKLLSELNMIILDKFGETEKLYMEISEILSKKNAIIKFPNLSNLKINLQRQLDINKLEENIEVFISKE